MIRAAAPVRICDIGGWTDTWFGGPGRVLNIAVRPGVEVTLSDSGDTINTPLVQAALDTYPADLKATVHSDIPAGSGAGTSAAVAVALIGALAAARGEPMSALDVAQAAHRLETEVLGAESGVQDQLCSASGGISYIEVDRYPHASVTRLPIWPELDDLLSLVFLGRPHDSSTVHRQVIEHAATNTAFDRLRQAAAEARLAVEGRDLRNFGRAMIANTEAQQALHPDLVGEDSLRVIELARTHGALGWKVNGAGGEGGSLTILHANRDQKESFDPGYRLIPVTVSPTGLEVTSRPVP